MPSRIAVAVISAGVALLVTGCTGSPVTAPSQPPASEVAERSETSSPSPSVTPDSATIPTDCSGLVSPDVYAATFGDTPLNDPAVLGPEQPGGVISPTTAPPGSTPAEVMEAAVQLNCVWRYLEADITYVQATVGRVDSTIGNQYLDSLAAEGYTCTEVHDGRLCQLITPNEQYPVDDARTDFFRDGVHIFVGQSNVKTNDLIGSIVEVIWAS